MLVVRHYPCEQAGLADLERNLCQTLSIDEFGLEVLEYDKDGYWLKFVFAGKEEVYWCHAEQLFVKYRFSNRFKRVRDDHKRLSVLGCLNVYRIMVDLPLLT